MKLVQPIRTREGLIKMKKALSNSSNPKRNLFLFTLGINTGLRISDMLDLKVKDVRDKTHIKLKEQKTNKFIRFPIYAIVDEVEMYTDRMDDDDWLFPSRTGSSHITRKAAHDILKKASYWAGIEEVGCHSMRKTFGYHYYQRTKDIALLMTIFNHSSQSVTKRYIGIEQDEIDSSLAEFKL